jgi:predicted glycogen debranching enzyme
MTFGLTSWLKQKHPDLTYEVPVWYPASGSADHREWLVVNGLGGYSAGTLSGANRRRYHGLLVSALNAPRDRHIILSKLDEIVTVDGQEYELTTNEWASGVVSPTGYKLLESFTTLPSPTWVYAIGNHYLVKQLTLKWGTNELYACYSFVPGHSAGKVEASIKIRVLAAFRSFHSQVHGSSEFHYPQFVSPKGSVVRINEADRRLCLSWTHGSYEPQRQWWWDFAWHEETARGEKDSEDLLLVGTLNAELSAKQPLMMAASLDRPAEIGDINEPVAFNLKRQRGLLERSALPKNVHNSLLTVACDQFIVKNKPDGDKLTVIAGYPWFADFGRWTLISLPGLTLSTNRYEEAKKVLLDVPTRMRDGLLPLRFLESSGEPEYSAVDITLWWAWALHHYVNASKDKELMKSQLPLLEEAANHFIRGTNDGIRVDPKDGLLLCHRRDGALTWMDSKVADFPITERAGKPVEIQALWLNFLSVCVNFAEQEGLTSSILTQMERLRDQAMKSMQRFWNNETAYLFDVIDGRGRGDRHDDDSLRPNQIFAVAMPYRAFDKEQQQAILTAVDAFLLTPTGVRTLAQADESYQGRYGCGLAHADQYHRDLSYYQGTAWPYLLGFYIEAYVNVHGNTPATLAKVDAILAPLLQQLENEGALGAVNELVDGDRPYTARGCFAFAASTAELMRWQKWKARQSY